MLQKIISIKNVGRFRNSVASGDVTFRRVTLIFAENGRGKTTFCAILRSLATNTPALIIGRKTLGNADPQEVQLLFDSNTITFHNEAWSAALPDIAIFDGSYISDNVFAGDIVDTEHRRNLYRIIIGARGVTLASRVNELDEQIRIKNGEIREGRTRMQQYVPHGMTVEAFMGLSGDATIDQKIAAKERELQAAQSAVQLQQRAILAPITAPVFPPVFAQTLAKTIENLATGAEKSVVEHIARHNMQTGGETWLREGLSYATGDTCPFCGQSLTGMGLIQAYQTFFSREYHTLRDEVEALSEQIENALAERVAAGIEQAFLQNNNNLEFWRQYCDFIDPPLPQVTHVGDIVASLRESAKSLLQIKTGRPLEAVAPNEAYTITLEAFDALRASLAAYNAAVAAANAVIAARKQSTQTTSARDVEDALAHLRAQKARHSQQVSDLCAADARQQGEKQALETEKSQAREQLDTHTTQVITQYGESINRYLERINAGFRITAPSHNYRGGVPNTSYQILINQSAVDLGDAETPTDRPSFKNTLSAGDRSTLALAFFFAQLEQDPNRTHKIVVFDDPFSSMDNFRRNNTVHRIFKCGETCAQVILLSHEPNFLKLLWDRLALVDRKTLQLDRLGEDNTIIVEWDIERAVQARYLADVDALQRFFSSGDGEQREVIQKIRPVLEGYCRNLYPTLFVDQDTLGVIVGKIRTAGVTHPLQSIADDLEELNVYCRRYHHGENPGAATEPIDDVELQGYVKRTLLLVGYTI